MEMDGEARPGEEDGKAGLEEEDGEAGLEEEDGEARPGEEGKAKVTATEALATLSFLTMTETLLWLGLSLRRVGKGTPAVVRPDNKVTLAFERSGLLGLCNSFTSARTLLVNRITPPPACRSSPRGAAGARAFFTRGRTFTDLMGWT